MPPAPLVPDAEPLMPLLVTLKAPNGSDMAYGSNHTFAVSPMLPVTVEMMRKAMEVRTVEPFTVTSALFPAIVPTVS